MAPSECRILLASAGGISSFRFHHPNIIGTRNLTNVLDNLTGVWYDKGTNKGEATMKADRIAAKDVLIGARLLVSGIPRLVTDIRRDTDAVSFTLRNSETGQTTLKRFHRFDIVRVR